MAGWPKHLPQLENTTAFFAVYLVSDMLTIHFKIVSSPNMLLIFANFASWLSGGIDIGGDIAFCLIKINEGWLVATAIIILS